MFNPDHEWEFAGHHVDREIEYLRLERKEDWGVPLTPNGKMLKRAIVDWIKEGKVAPEPIRYQDKRASA